MLLVLSLWALEFCLSFMEVLRGRLCSLFSILLWNEWEWRQNSGKFEGERKPPLRIFKLRPENQMCMWGNSCKNITILSCLHVSTCGDLRSTWETCGSGIQPCWACQRCWSGDRCWHPSCSLLQARCHRAPAPGSQKVRAKWTNREGEGGGGRGHFWQGSVGPSISDLHHFLSGTSAFSAWWRHVLHSTSCGGEGLTGLKGCVYRKQCKPPWQIQVIYVCLVKKTKFWNTQSESQRLDNWHERCTAAFPARLSLLIYNRRLCSLACVLLNMPWFFLENTEKPSARQGAWAKRWGGGQKRKTGERKDSLGI